jgi:hypothetical protein
MSTNEIYELAAHQRVAGQDVVNVTHYRYIGGGTVGQSHGLTLGNDFKEAIRARQNATNVSWTTWTLRQVWGTGVTYNNTQPIRTGGALFEGAYTGTLTGGVGTGEMLPPATAALVKLTTGLAGRSKRGRFYVAGLGVGGLTNGTLNSVEETALQGGLDTWFNKYKADGGTSPDFTLVIFSFRLASGWRRSPSTGDLEYVGPIATDDSSFNVTSVDVQSIWRQQRRREIGVGT